MLLHYNVVTYNQALSKWLQWYNEEQSYEPLEFIPTLKIIECIMSLGDKGGGVIYISYINIIFYAKL